MGVAIMGTGVATGEDRAEIAATAAINSPLLENASVDGARGVIINVTGGPDLTLAEVDAASKIVQGASHEDANIIFGAVEDPRMTGEVKITVIATGFNEARTAASPATQAATTTPVDLSTYTTDVRELEEPIAANGGRVVISRRPPVDLGLSGVSSGQLSDDAPGGAAEDGDDEAASPLDIPAFLRRREG